MDDSADDEEDGPERQADPPAQLQRARLGTFHVLEGELAEIVLLRQRLEDFFLFMPSPEEGQDTQAEEHRPYDYEYQPIALRHRHQPDMQFPTL